MLDRPLSSEQPPEIHYFINIIFFVSEKLPETSL
jgi:hypothetical protein